MTEPKLAPPEEIEIRHKRNIRTLITIIVGFIAIFLLFGILSSLNPPESTTTAITATKTIRPSVTPKPTNTVYIDPKAIPGLKPADIKVNLEERGFECTTANEIELVGETSYLWECEKKTQQYEAYVEFSSNRLNTVNDLQISVLQSINPSMDTAKPLLQFFATFAFLDNPEKQEAIKEWVSESLINTEEVRFEYAMDDLTFDLIADETLHMLTITK